jgi:FSR family fosmidomycin resistance protein-like MFS transporter
LLAGAGNGVFHPVDYTLINRKVSASRAWATPTACTASPAAWAGPLAPALLVPLTLAYSWRVALVCASLLAFAVLAVLL